MSRNASAARVGLFEIDYPDVESRQRFFEDLRMRLSAQPGVVAASLAQSLPVQFFGRNPVPFGLEGESYATFFDRPRAHRNLISAGFFDTFAAEILLGRDFNELDTADSLRVAIVNRTFVESFFRDGDPLGKRIYTSPLKPEDAAAWVTIVGVVGDPPAASSRSFLRRSKSGVGLNTRCPGRSRATLPRRGSRTIRWSCYRPSGCRL